MHTKLKRLKALLTEVDDLTSAASLLMWDQHTHMPEGGSEARGRQVATLQRLAHTKFTSDEVGRLLVDLSRAGADLPFESDDAALLRVTRRKYAEATQVSSDFVAELSSHLSAIFNVWIAARPAGDFDALCPYLEKSLELSRRYADFFPGHAESIDPLIALSDYGMDAASVGRIFADLRRALVPLVRAIAERPAIDDSLLFQPYPEDAQLAFCEDVARRLGYDFSRGRYDKSPHPFATRFSINDVRITIRTDSKNLNESVFGMIHEVGHAMYEQNVSLCLESTPLAGGASAGVHESQSRLWENLVGRRRDFWHFFFPRLRAVFPDQLAHTTPDAFYRAINKVVPSLIRVDADEVTYNLHVMLRFDLERALLNGELAVADLPDAWNARMQSDLGVTPRNHSEGVLQDVHWFDGMIGGSFQGYALGNVMSAQIFEAALAAHPSIPAQIRAGDFDQLRGWQIENVYCHGAKFTAAELMERITGGPLTIEPYLSYLTTKYGELYEL